MRNTAKEYKNYGLAVLPCKLDKSPDLRESWKFGVDDLSKFDNAKGIGIICGELSGGLECLDFDNHQGTAKENLTNFVKGIDEIYKKHKFVIESTQNKGFHMLYRCSKVEGNQKLASVPVLKNDRWVPDAIIETRGEGGYFVSAPTPGYKVIRNNILDIPKITVEEREILISTAKSFNEFHVVRKEYYEQDERPGDRFNNDLSSVSEMKSCLTSHGWKELRKGIWQRPDKKKGISATLGQVAPNVFYNFSANAYPFDVNSAYTPFQVISILDYNSDFKAFAKDLAKRYEPIKTVPITEKKEKTELEKILANCMVDLDKPIERPPIAMTINNVEGNFINEKRLFTLGNFSSIIGKGKSKKSMFVAILLAAAAKNDLIYKKFKGHLPVGKKFVLYFDTEQSRFDCVVNGKRVESIMGEKRENFGIFNLREYTPNERCELIGFALEKLKSNLGFVVIDGIADLVNSINDEVEASKVVSLLMKWSKVYKCHIVTVIHQNKGDNYATGHLGSAILKKAEAIISVTKDAGDKSLSKVSCDMIRGVADFNDFEMKINDEGIPEILEMGHLSNFYETKEIEF